MESTSTTDTENPFKYCGEYVDEETGFVYLRNRYYDPSIGCFTTIDPAKDGLNWYVYCGNNPVNAIDPLGLFDYNSRLQIGSRGNDVKVLQNELKYLNCYSGEIDGIFGKQTQTAVNKYKSIMGFGNSGKDAGVVGLQTWSSLGLIHRAKEDVQAGVGIVTEGYGQYFDISIPVTNAVKKSQGDFEKHNSNVAWFIEKVKNNGKWNIKRNAKAWSDALGISQATYGKDVFFYGRRVVADDIGNITYGYLGRAAGFSKSMLISGSMGYHIWNHAFNGMQNEYKDESFVKLGADWYDGKNIEVRFS